MANVNQVSLGRINNPNANPALTAADNRDLYLKLASGEIFKGFENATIARDLVMKRTLTNGKSLQFIYTGRTSADYHTPGTPILGNSDKAPPVAEKTITVDDLLISSAFLYDLDQTLAHYDLRSEITRKIGYALAETYDRKIFRSITRGARAASPVSSPSYIEPGGTQVRVTRTGVTDETAAYDAEALVTAFYDAAAALDEKGVSQDGRVGILNPRQYYKLIQEVGENGLINRDEQGTARQRGNGIVEIAGIKIYKSMNIPFLGKFGTEFSASGVADPGNTGSFIGETMADDEAVTGDNYGSRNNYGAANKFAHSCGLIFQREAAGCVESIGPQVQVTSGDVNVMYQGDLMVGRLAMGSDYLNPAACVELLAGADGADAAENTNGW